jgi:hypothetical protein
MPKALRVMTFNTQQLPWLGRVISGLPVVGSPGGAPEPDPEGRARAVARAILDLPLREQPDIVAFNEAFSETGRKWLLRSLKGKYPHVIEKLEHPGPDVEEDSGLMLFSKLPFITLPNGDDHIFEVFSRTAGSDSKASKGVGLVRVNGPYDPTTVVFTHLQASYDAANTENADIRADQLGVVRDQIRKLSELRVQQYAGTVVVGDLNIKGDPDDTTGERNSAFSATPDTFGNEFDDAWRANMHPPGDPKDYDPGYTQRDTPTYQPNRFDYQCVWRDPSIDVGLVTHHMAVPIRLPSEITDHGALYAHLHRLSPNCTPALAIDLLGTDPVNKNAPESSVWLLGTNFRDQDMFQWVYLAEPGTFSVVVSSALEVHAFRRTDFTNALDPIDTVSTADLPSSLQTAVTQRTQQLESRGKTFSWREPFFLRLRGKAATFAGKAPYAIIRHRGESRATAVVLHPHLAVDPDLPAGQKLGVTDECFFRADRHERFSGEPYLDRFELRNRAHVGARIELRVDADPTLPPLSKDGGNGGVLAVSRTGGGPETVFIILRRDFVNDTKFAMLWDSPLNFLRLDESLRLHIDDETGPDWLGEDEFELQVTVDGESVYYDTWDDADAGEDWPDLARAIRDSARSRQGQDKWIAFTSDITWDILKTDGIAAHGSEIGIIHALDSSDADQESRTSAIVISAGDSDGKVTAYVSLSKFPPV